MLFSDHEAISNNVPNPLRQSSPYVARQKCVKVDLTKRFARCCVAKYFVSPGSLFVNNQN